MNLYFILSILLFFFGTTVGQTCFSVTAEGYFTDYSADCGGGSDPNCFFCGVTQPNFHTSNPQLWNNNVYESWCNTNDRCSFYCSGGSPNTPLIDHQFRWGTPSSAPSGFGFTPNTGATTLCLGEYKALGQVFHINNPINGGSGVGAGDWWKMKFFISIQDNNWCDGATTDGYCSSNADCGSVCGTSREVFDIEIEFNLDETPNGGFPCDYRIFCASGTGDCICESDETPVIDSCDRGCPDLVSIVDSQNLLSTKSFSQGPSAATAKGYTINMAGFSSTPTSFATPEYDWTTQEKELNVKYLMMSIIRECPQDTNACASGNFVVCPNDNTECCCECPDPPQCTNGKEYDNVCNCVCPWENDEPAVQPTCDEDYSWNQATCECECTIDCSNNAPKTQENTDLCECECPSPAPNCGGDESYNPATCSCECDEGKLACSSPKSQADLTNCECVCPTGWNQGGDCDEANYVEDEPNCQCVCGLDENSCGALKTFNSNNCTCTECPEGYNDDGTPQDDCECVKVCTGNTELNEETCACDCILTTSEDCDCPPLADREEYTDCEVPNGCECKPCELQSTDPSVYCCPVPNCQAPLLYVPDIDRCNCIDCEENDQVDCPCIEGTQFEGQECSEVSGTCCYDCMFTEDTCTDNLRPCDIGQCESGVCTATGETNCGSTGNDCTYFACEDTGCEEKNYPDYTSCGGTTDKCSKWCIEGTCKSNPLNDQKCEKEIEEAGLTDPNPCLNIVGYCDPATGTCASRAEGEAGTSCNGEANVCQASIGEDKVLVYCETEADCEEGDQCLPNAEIAYCQEDHECVAIDVDGISIFECRGTVDKDCESEFDEDWPECWVFTCDAPDFGRCIKTANSAECDDGDVCTTSTCISGNCEPTGNPCSSVDVPEEVYEDEDVDLSCLVAECLDKKNDSPDEDSTYEYGQGNDKYYCYFGPDDKIGDSCSPDDGLNECEINPVCTATGQCLPEREEGCVPTEELQEQQKEQQDDDDTAAIIGIAVASAILLIAAIIAAIFFIRLLIKSKVTDASTWNPDQLTNTQASPIFDSTSTGTNNPVFE